MRNATTGADYLAKAARGTSRYWYIQIAIILSGVSVFAQLYLFQPLLPELGREFALGPAMSSLSVSAGTAGMAAGLFTFAFWADVLSRKKLMVASMFGAALLTLITAASPNFGMLVAVTFLKGMAISGISAVALAYLAEEVEVASLGIVVSLYLGGNTFGGMWGRVFSDLSAGWAGWRWATVLIGGIGFMLALIFKYLLPPSNHFESKRISTGYKIRQMRIFLRDRVLLCMFCIAALIMGAFVSIYNYLSFRLEAPPFSLPSYIVASVFLMYLTGIAGSVVAGWFTDRFRPQSILKMLIGIFLVSTLMLLTPNIWIFVVGLGIATFSFFGAHTMASHIISQHVASGKSTATSLYWLFYYVGSSIIGTVMGVALSALGWTPFIVILIAILILAFLAAVISDRASAVGFEAG